MVSGCALSCGLYYLDVLFGVGNLGFGAEVDTLEAVCCKGVLGVCCGDCRSELVIVVGIWCLCGFEICVGLIIWVCLWVVCCWGGFVMVLAGVVACICGLSCVEVFPDCDFIALRSLL